MAQVKSYELLTVEAAVHGDRMPLTRRCWRTPGSHRGPGGGVLDDLLETHRDTCRSSRCSTLSGLHALLFGRRRRRTKPTC